MVRQALVRAVIVFVVLAGCTPSADDGDGGASGTDPTPDAAPSSAATDGGTVAGAPAITEADAREVLETYNRKNNRANARLNSKLLKTIEAESAFALDNAVYRIGHKLDPDNSDPIQPYQWTDPEFHIPAVADGAAPWFVAEVSTDGDPEGRDVLVFTSKGEGRPWKLAFYAGVDDGLPELETTADGTAVALEPTAEAGLQAAPADVAAAHATFLTSGEDSPEAAGLGAHARSQEIVDDRSEGTDLRETFGAADSFEREVTVPDHPVRALQTADGGAVAFYVTRQRVSVRKSDGIFTVEGHLAALGAEDVLVTPTGDEVFLVGLDITWLDTWVTAVPASGSGELSVLGNRAGMVRVEGADPSEYPSELPPELEALLPERA